MAAPDVSRKPVFDQTFAGADTAGFAPTGDAKCHVATAVSDDHLLVSSERNSSVEVLDVKTLAPLRTLEGVEGARGAAAYRGEGFVADRANRIFVFDPATGSYKRRFDHPGSLLVGAVPALRQVAVTGLDVAWGEIWATFQTAAGHGVTVMDASTGLPKSVFFQLPRYNCSTNPLALRLSNPGACTGTTGVAVACASRVAFAAGSLKVDPSVCTAQVAPGYDTGGFDWWDDATAPELDGTVAGCRFLRRGPLMAAASAPDAITGLTSSGWQQCADSQYQDGIDAVWGMKWMLSLSGDSRSVPANRINEYALSAPGGTSPVFDGPKRTWTPRDSDTVNHRDIAYRKRDLRIDWSGDLTKTTWQKGQRCADYKVTDADIFVVGRRGERWLELARGLKDVHFEIDGVKRGDASTSPSGQLCFNLDEIDSGTYTARLVATADAGQGDKPAEAVNPTLKIDHDNPTVTPSGELWDLRNQYLDGRSSRVVTAEGRDVHSGVARMAVGEVGGAEVGDAPVTCQPEQCPLSSSLLLTAATQRLGEGKHALEETTSDLVGNIGKSSPWDVYVDRTPPKFSSEFMITAGFDSSTDSAIVDWDPAVDPALIDGNPGSGLRTYKVQYRIEPHADGSGGTGWSPEQETILERVKVPGASRTSRITLLVTPRDQVGNETSKQVNVAVDGDASACDPTLNGYTADCLDDADGLQEDDEDGVDWEPAQSGFSSRSAEPCASCRVKVHPPGGGIATIRSWHGSFVIGNVLNGTVMDIGDEADGSWVPGHLYQNTFNGCGWVYLGTHRLAPTGDPGRTNCDKSFHATEESIGDGFNCHGGSNCTNGTTIQIKTNTQTPLPACLNVSPSPYQNVPMTCKDAYPGRISADAIRDGYTVSWRYTTNDNRFVLVKDPHIDRTSGNWYFLPRRALIAHLCNRTFGHPNRIGCGPPQP